jgi:hypothetical protein
MQWFSSSSPLVSLTLRDDVSDIAWCLDVVPSRWRADNGLPHALMTLLARWIYLHNSSRTFTRPSGWNSVRPTFLIDLATSGYAHPDFSFGPGGIAVHTGAALPGPSLLIADNTLYPLNAPSLSLADFTSGAKYWYATATHEKALDLLQRVAKGPSTTPLFQFLGLMDGFLRVYIDQGDSLPLVHHVFSHLHLSQPFACVFPLLAAFPNTPTRQERWMSQHGHSLASALMQAWILFPDQGWNAQRLCYRPEKYSFMRAVHSSAFHLLGKKLALAYLDCGMPALSLPLGDSAHATLIHTRYTQQAESLTLSHFASIPGILTDKAVRKATKLLSHR